MALVVIGENIFIATIYGPHWPLVALTVGFALVGVVLWGSLSGSMLPFILRRVGADPATSSAPFVATLVDVTGLIIYFSIALLIMRGAMLITEHSMFSIRQFLGHDEKFYDLLEASAQQADSSVHHLVDFSAKLEHTIRRRAWTSSSRSRRKDKRITQELTEQLCKTFITPLEREDIQALAAALYKIPKTVEKIGERILICPERTARPQFSEACANCSTRRRKPCWRW